MRTDGPRRCIRVDRGRDGAGAVSPAMEELEACPSASTGFGCRLACAPAAGSWPSSRPPAAPRKGRSAPSVFEAPVLHVVHPQLRKIVRVVGQPSFVQSYERTSIYPKMTAYIEKWNVDIGDKVQKGDVLADLFVPELRETVGNQEGDRRVRFGSRPAGPEGRGGRRRRGQGGKGSA